MENLLKYIETHIEDDFSTQRLADIAGYSRYHFVKKFKQKTMCTPMEYIWRRKLVRSAEDILAGRKIIDVAYQYGFQNSQSYCKAFRRAFGVRPSILKAISMGMTEIKGESIIFMNSVKKYADKEDLLAVLKDVLAANAVVYEDTVLESMYSISCRAYAGIKRYSGEDYVTHPLNVAIILANMEAEIDVVYAGLLCDVEQKGCVSLENLRPEIPMDVFKLAAEIQDCDKPMEELSEGGKLIRLAERLHNMRTIDAYVNKEKRDQKVKETIEVYLPLARRFQNEKLIDELNDLAMKFVT